jgi:sugar/nucleoside kinase (ribokinase family)
MWMRGFLDSLSERRLIVSPHQIQPFVFAIVGNINVDIKPSVITASSELLADGETSVDHVRESIGGGGANTAVAAALMGAEAHFCGCVGNDELGHRLVRHMRSLGVVTHVATRSVSTGRSIALSWSNGQRHFISSLPNNACLDMAAVDLDAIFKAGCRHLYRADIWFSREMLFGGNEVLLRAVREAGIETSVDINWDPLWSTATGDAEVRRRIDAVAKILNQITYVHGNERELMFFTDRKTIREAAQVLSERGARTVIVHRGARGSAALWEGEWIEVPAVTVSRIVSETGSGDVFTAAFIINSGLAIADRLAKASEVASQHLRGTPCYIPFL